MSTPSEASLYHHLRYNHFPPVSDVWIKACQDAIDACDEGDSSREISVPSATVCTMPAYDIVEGLHLDGFCDTLDLY